jgi:hypothetical protein
LILGSFVELGYTTRYTIALACARKLPTTVGIGVFDQLGRARSATLLGVVFKLFPP